MRSDAYIRVTCDLCKTEEEVQLTALAGGAYDERGMDRKIEALGWRVTDGKDICEECRQESET